MTRREQDPPSSGTDTGGGRTVKATNASTPGDGLYYETGQARKRKLPGHKEIHNSTVLGLGLMFMSYHIYIIIVMTGLAYPEVEEMVVELQARRLPSH